jgi:hypothetical protein
VAARAERHLFAVFQQQRVQSHDNCQFVTFDSAFVDRLASRFTEIGGISGLAKNVDAKTIKLWIRQKCRRPLLLPGGSFELKYSGNIPNSNKK